jgi:hypothetical protein
MSDWARWLLIGLAVLLVIALVAYARGERQRGDVVPEASAAVIAVTAATGSRGAPADGVSWS